MTKVSIIVPTYNRAHILKNTIDSILAQTYSDYELLIVSNGSTDNTEQVVREYKDSRIKYFYQKGSGSPASPRNNGIRNASSEYIAFCDDDDLWLPNKLEKQLAFLMENPDYGVCYTKMKRFYADKEWINTDEETNTPIGSKELLYRNTAPLSSLVIRKNLLLQTGFFDEDKYIAAAEDYELLLRLSTLTKFWCVPEYLLRYYSGENRMTNTSAVSNFKRNLKYLRRTANVYKIVVNKGYFKYSDVLLPFMVNSIQVGKRILYDAKSAILKIIF